MPVALRRGLPGIHRRKSITPCAASGPSVAVPPRSGRGGIVFFLATIALNGLNFGFQVFVSRVLGPTNYSALSALLALLTIASVPLSAIQLSCASAQTRLPGAADPRRIIRVVGVAGLIAAATLIAAEPVVDGFLQLTTVVPLLWLCGWLVLAAVSAVPQGLLIGQSRFTVLGLTALLGGGLGRLTFGISTAALHLGVSGGMAATTLGQGLTLLLLLLATRAKGGEERPELTLSAAEGALSTAALSGLAVFTAVDPVLARHTLDSIHSGYYSSAETAGRIALFAPGAVAVLAFPRFVKAAETGKSDRRDLLLALAGVAGVGVAVVLVVLAVPQLVIDVLFGTAYRPAVHQLEILAPAGALLGCLTLATYYHLARGSSFALAAWVGTAAIVGAEARTQLSGDDLAAAVVITVGVLAVTSLGWAFVTKAPLSASKQSTTGRRGTATAAAALTGAETGAVVAPGVARKAAD
jgi:O-antigen/teichoic acid export membrane protein